jgi:hypothetical protein
MVSLRREGLGKRVLGKNKCKLTRRDKTSRHRLTDTDSKAKKTEREANSRMWTTYTLRSLNAHTDTHRLMERKRDEEFKTKDEDCKDEGGGQDFKADYFTINTTKSNTRQRQKQRLRHKQTHRKRQDET